VFIDGDSILAIEKMGQLYYWGPIAIRKLGKAPRMFVYMAGERLKQQMAENITVRAIRCYAVLSTPSACFFQRLCA